MKRDLSNLFDTQLDTHSHEQSLTLVSPHGHWLELPCAPTPAPASRFGEPIQIGDLSKLRTPPDSSIGLLRRFVFKRYLLNVVNVKQRVYFDHLFGVHI